MANDADAGDVAIDVADVTKRFGTHRALNGVTFQVPRGSVFGVIGPNGAGKTTIMRALLDIIRPSSGRATILGTDSRHAGPELRRRIGYLPGDLTLEGRVTGRRLLKYYADISGPVPEGRIGRLAERLDVDLDRPVRTLSKGNRQKLGVIQAFMHNPELLVLDEPTSGLDPLVQQEFLRMVKEASAAGQTIFLSSHMISQIEQAADEVAILRDGRILTIAGVEELRTSAIRHLRIKVDDLSPTELHARLALLGGIRDLTCVLTPQGQAEATAVLQGGHGGIQSLVQALSVVELADLVVEEPDLEESVLALYTAPDSSGPTTVSE